MLWPSKPVLDVDEKGHKDRGDRMWTPRFRAELNTLYYIDAKRSADVLRDILGTDFHGTLGCDSFSAYRSYQRD